MGPTELCVSRLFTRAERRLNGRFGTEISIDLDVNYLMVLMSSTVVDLIMNAQEVCKVGNYALFLFRI